MTDRPHARSFGSVSVDSSEFELSLDHDELPPEKASSDDARVGDAAQANIVEDGAAFLEDLQDQSSFDGPDARRRSSAHKRRESRASDESSMSMAFADADVEKAEPAAAQAAEDLKRSPDAKGDEDKHPARKKHARSVNARSGEQNAAEETSPRDVTREDPAPAKRARRERSTARRASAEGESASERIESATPIAPFIAVPALLLIVFIAFALLSSQAAPLELAFAGVTLVAFAALVLRALPGMVRLKDGVSVRTVGERSARRLHPVASIVFFSVFAQLALIVLVYAMRVIIKGFDGVLPAAYPGLFITGGGAPFGDTSRGLACTMGLLSLVFPYGFEGMLSTSAFVLCAFIVNLAATAASSVLLYELVLVDHDKRTAKFSVLLLHLLPTALFLARPFDGTALFFALVLASLLCARRGRPVWAGAFALLSCAFNMLGVLLIAPIMIECALRIKGATDADKAPSRLRVFLGALLPLCAVFTAILMIASGGSGLYAFMSEAGLFFEPLGRLVVRLFRGDADRAVTLASVFGVAVYYVLLILTARRARSSYFAFTALLFALASSVFAPELALYAVFASPLLPALVADRYRSKTIRLGAALIAIALMVFFIGFVYI